MANDISQRPNRAQDTADLVPDAPPLHVVAAGLTDRGLKRSKNEDQFAVAELAKIMRVDQTSVAGPDVRVDATPTHLFVVADGMGGYAGGEIASRMAISTVEECLLNSLKWFRDAHGAEGQEVAANLKAAVDEADQRVHHETGATRELRNMGSTLTMAFHCGSELFVAHVGDSRAYLCRDRVLHQMTRDHTLYAERARRGELPAEADELSRLKRTVTNAVGGGHRGVHTDVIRVSLADGDQLLLCTDGLTEMVKDRDIADVMAEHTDPDASCEKLVALANERGGRDNITVIVAAFRAKAG